MAIRIDVKLHAVRPEDIFELITVLIVNISNLLTWTDIINVIFFLHSICSFPKKPKILSANYIPEYSVMLFIEICVVYSGVYCSNNAKYICDGSGNSRDDERG